MADANAVTTASGLERAASSKTVAAFLAVDGDHAVSGCPQLIEEAPETRRKSRRVKQPKNTREGVVAWHPMLQPQELAEQVLSVDGKVSKNPSSFPLRTLSPSAQSSISQEDHDARHCRSEGPVARRTPCQTMTSGGLLPSPGSPLKNPFSAQRYRFFQMR